MDEVGDTCDAISVGSDCTDKNTFISSHGFTPEGWKDLLRNCAVSCNLCDSGTSRRRLEDDLPSDPCLCMPTWSMPKVDPNCANQQGCPASACDNDTIGPWCLVLNRGCATAESGGSWAYCSPGTSVVPTEFSKIRYPSVHFFRPRHANKIPTSEFLLFMSLFHTPSLSMSMHEISTVFGFSQSILTLMFPMNVS